MSDFIPDSEFKPDSVPQPAPPNSSDFIPDSKFRPDAPESEEQKANRLESQEQSNQSQYGTPGQTAIAGLEAAGRGLAGPLATGAERLAGVPAEDIRGREEANPITNVAGTIAGLVSPIGQGALLSKVGSKVAGGMVGKGILAGIARGAVKGMAENALYQSGDEISKKIVQDPSQSVSTAITNVGLATVLGGAIGGTLGGVSPLWKATVGNKADQLVADFQGRMQEHLNNPNPVESFSDELGQYHKNITDMADKVYGPSGLKAQEIEKLMPEMSPKISQQAQELSDKAEQIHQDMIEKVPERLQKKYLSDLNQFQSKVTEPNASPSDVFQATQDFKQTLQGYSKGNFGPFAVPSYHEAYDFLNMTKNLAHDIRIGLEDKSVWGQAAERQQAVNKAFSKYLPSLEDFEKKFTTELNGQRVIDPGKVNTYLNQLGKSSSEIKQAMLENFLNDSENYRKTIADTHANLGLENPMPSSSLNHVRNTLNDLSPGGKLADIFVKHAGDLGGKTLGGGLGAALGHATHIPGAGFLGTIIGERALGPFLGKILPSIAKPIVEGMASGEGFKSAIEFTSQSAKGYRLLKNGVKGVFDSGVKILPDHLWPDKESRIKLEEQLSKIKQDPSVLANVSGHIGHYMPDHAVAMGSTISNITNFLNSIKPQPIKKTMLDPKLKPSQAIQSQYNRALDIAQQPLIVLQSIKDGTLTSHDVVALQKMYPQLYEGLKSSIMEQIVESKSKDENIPYAKRLTLSLMLSQPLDSTMLPQSILGAQPTPQNPPQTSIGVQKGKSKGAPSRLKGEGVKLAMTGDQNNEAISQGAKKA